MEIEEQAMSKEHLIPRCYFRKTQPKRIKPLCDFFKENRMQYMVAPAHYICNSFRSNRSFIASSKQLDQI
ncbi:MAG TPA: hypothetical protein VMV86_04340, partial [Methanosarcinales archaeon]|nr:hypothetical protein [Methanosarcinales archaeon]